MEGKPQRSWVPVSGKIQLQCSFSLCQARVVSDRPMLRQRGHLRHWAGQRGRGERHQAEQPLEEGEVDLAQVGSPGYVDLPPSFDSIEAQIWVFQTSVDQHRTVKRTMMKLSASSLTSCTIRAASWIAKLLYAATAGLDGWIERADGSHGFSYT